MSNEGERQSQGEEAGLLPSPGGSQGAQQEHEALGPGAEPEQRDPPWRPAGQLAQRLLEPLSYTLEDLGYKLVAGSWEQVPATKNRLQSLAAKWRDRHNVHISDDLYASLLELTPAMLVEPILTSTERMYLRGLFPPPREAYLPATPQESARANFFYDLIQAHLTSQVRKVAADEGTDPGSLLFELLEATRRSAPL